MKVSFQNTMNIINIGSLNIEHVLQLPRFPSSQDRLYCRHYQRLPGGKGYYQSVAMARAGAKVWHIGFIGPDGHFLRDSLKHNNVDVRYVHKTQTPTGQEHISITPDCHMTKVRYMGANACFEPHFLDCLFKQLQEKQLVLVQNEVNDIPKVFEQIKSYNLNLTFHPAPYSEDIKDYPLHMVDTLIFNLNTGQKLSNEQEPEKILKSLLAKYPNTALVLTLGAKGAWYVDNHQKIKVPGDPVMAIDESQAGNTFVGYFLAQKSQDNPIESCIKFACRASALCVSREGKSATIPYLTEIK